MVFASLRPGPILEPMCGTGRFLAPLAEQRREVVGFDRSPAMLELCRKRNLPIALHEGSWDLPLEPSYFQSAFIPAGSFGHLISESQANQLFSALSKWLAPGGRFFFEVETTNAIGLIQPGWQGRFVRRSDDSKIVLSTLSELDSIRQIETTLFRYEVWEENRVVATEVEELQMRYYELAEIEEMISNSPLELIAAYTAYTSDPAESTTPVAIFECLQK